MPPRRKTLKDKLPEALKACQDGWTIDQGVERKAYKLMTEDEFLDEYATKSLQATYRHLASSMSARLASQGLEVSSVNVYKQLLSEIAVHLILDSTNEQLTLKGHPAATSSEYRRFLHHKTLASRFNISLDLFWTEFMPFLSQKHGFALMDLTRFRALLRCTCGFSVQGRTGNNDEDTWFQGNRLLRNLEDVEKAVFQPTVQLCLNKESGVLVVDDELIGSRAQDVELKSLSYRKADKEGPVADCVADSILGIMFGSRLRIRSEPEKINVEKLLERSMPRITSNLHNIRLHCDRGYGKMAFVMLICRLGFNLSTIANSYGSRHPFITTEEVEKANLAKKWSKLQPPPSEQEKADALNSFKPFVLPATQYFGPAVNVATKELELEGGKKTKLMATAVHDVFDKNNHHKYLRFFSTGSVETGLSCVWISTKKGVHIPSNTLFSSKPATIEKEAVESKLLETCNPLTQMQRTGDWFNQKALRLTGTMASKVVSASDASDEELTNLLNDCFNSWFGRHISTEAMKIGSTNEIPTAEKLANESWVLEFYEVGLLEWKEASFIGVSPDGIARINVPANDADIESSNSDGDETALHYASVEMKTRSSPNTIEKAQKAASDHGKLVYCTYDDDKFKSCVPAENRKQLLHQALVTGLNYCVFVTSKVEYGEGSMVQIVVVKVRQQQKESHSQALLRIGTKLLGWMFTPLTLNRGYLKKATDFPSWVEGDQVEVITSHFPLWCSQYNQIRRRDAGEPYKASDPVGVYKHSQQMIYCKGKWGVDKNTECSKTIAFKTTGLSFEAKYIFRMIDSLTFTHWRIEQARQIVVPRLQAEGSLKAEQIRRAARNLALEDHVYNLAIESLKAMELDIRFANTAGARQEETMTQLQLRQEQEIVNGLDAFKRKHKFPIKCRKVQLFDHYDCLRNLRMWKARRNGAIQHKAVKAPDQKKPGCALCVGLRRTRIMCSCCQVPLCTTLRKDDEEDGSSGLTHFERWHLAVNLKDESRKAREETEDSINTNGGGDNNDNADEGENDGENDDDVENDEEGNNNDEEGNNND